MNKNLGILAVVLLTVLAIQFVASAPIVTIVTPIRWANYSTSMAISVTNDLINATEISYNVTLYCNKSGGSTNARAGADIYSEVIWNNTAFDNSFTSTKTITAWTDSMLYNCSAFADNGTSYNMSIAVRNITKDSTSPSCSISVSYPTIHKDGLQTVTWSVIDALELFQNSEAITRPSPGTQITDANAVATYTLDKTNTSYVGTWYLNAYGIDRAGNTCNATTTFLSDQPGGTYTVPGTTGANTKAIVIIGIIALIAYLVFRKKK